MALPETLVIGESDFVKNKLGLLNIVESENFKMNGKEAVVRRPSGKRTKKTPVESSLTHSDSTNEVKCVLSNESDEDIERIFTPTIAPIHPCLTALSLTRVGGSSEELQPPALTDMPMLRMKSTSDLFAPARSFSTLSAPHTIREICHRKVPGWDVLSLDEIEVDQILSGLSNQLFRVHVQENSPNRSQISKGDVLFRIYGKDVNALYDSKTEIKVFKSLGRKGVAPQLIAECEGGRIEEWIAGSVLLVSDMCNPSVLLGVAAVLANIHNLDLSKHIDTEPCVLKFLDRWRDGAMKILKSMEPTHPSYLAIHRLDLPSFYEESFKLTEYLFPPGLCENEVTRLAFCHNDIQENNILVTETCLRVIDFEYSGYNFPATDIASYFWEMTCDYCVDAYPFFRIDPTKYPLLEKRRLFCAMYLSKLTKTTVMTSCHQRLDPVLDAVERFQLAIHMLWGFWSVIRAPQAATATSFDMLHYGQKRIDAYWAQKAKLIAEGKIQA